MKTRYQKGPIVELTTRSFTNGTTRVALPGTGAGAERKRLRGKWMTEKCEPVTIEYGPRRGTEYASDEDGICAAPATTRIV